MANSKDTPVDLLKNNGGYYIGQYILYKTTVGDVFKPENLRKFANHGAQPSLRNDRLLFLPLSAVYPEWIKPCMIFDRKAASSKSPQKFIESLVPMVTCIFSRHETCRPHLDKIYDDSGVYDSHRTLAKSLRFHTENNFSSFDDDETLPTGAEIIEDTLAEGECLLLYTIPYRLYSMVSSEVGYNFADYFSFDDDRGGADVVHGVDKVFGQWSCVGQNFKRGNNNSGVSLRTLGVSRAINSFLFDFYKMSLKFDDSVVPDDVEFAKTLLSLTEESDYVLPHCNHNLMGIKQFYLLNNNCLSTKNALNLDGLHEDNYGNALRLMMVNSIWCFKTVMNVKLPVSIVKNNRNFLEYETHRGDVLSRFQTKTVCNSRDHAAHLLYLTQLVLRDNYPRKNSLMSRTCEHCCREEGVCVRALLRSYGSGSIGAEHALKTAFKMATPGLLFMSEFNSKTTVLGNTTVRTEDNNDWKAGGPEKLVHPGVYAAFTATRREFDTIDTRGVVDEVGLCSRIHQTIVAMEDYVKGAKHGASIIPKNKITSRKLEAECSYSLKGSRNYVGYLSAFLVRGEIYKMVALNVLHFGNDDHKKKVMTLANSQHEMKFSNFSFNTAVIESDLTKEMPTYHLRINESTGTDEDFMETETSRTPVKELVKLGSLTDTLDYCHTKLKFFSGCISEREMDITTGEEASTLRSGAATEDAESSAVDTQNKNLSLRFNGLFGNMLSTLTNRNKTALSPASRCAMLDRLIHTDTLTSVYMGFFSIPYAMRLPEFLDKMALGMILYVNGYDVPSNKYSGRLLKFYRHSRLHTEEGQKKTAVTRDMFTPKCTSSSNLLVYSRINVNYYENKVAGSQVYSTELKVYDPAADSLWMHLAPDIPGHFYSLPLSKGNSGGFEKKEVDPLLTLFDNMRACDGIEQLSLLRGARSKVLRRIRNLYDGIEDETMAEEEVTTEPSTYDTDTLIGIMSEHYGVDDLVYNETLRTAFGYVFDCNDVDLDSMTVSETNVTTKVLSEQDLDSMTNENNRRKRRRDDDDDEGDGHHMMAAAAASKRKKRKRSSSSSSSSSSCLSSSCSESGEKKKENDDNDDEMESGEEDDKSDKDDPFEDV